MSAIFKDCHTNRIRTIHIFHYFAIRACSQRAACNLSGLQGGDVECDVAHRTEIYRVSLKRPTFYILETATAATKFTHMHVFNHVCHVLC